MADDILFEALDLPCGVRLKNRIMKSAMSDSLGDGAGDPSAAQIALYRLWAEGGAALALIGETQFAPEGLESPGNLLIGPGGDQDKLRALASAGAAEGAALWPQLGHAGLLSYPGLGRAAGPSAMTIDGRSGEEMSADDVAGVPARFAEAARGARALGFGGVQIHAAHGFLLSQFLSPLFNRRGDKWGGDAVGRARLTLETIAAVRDAVGADYPVGLKINGSDLIEGGVAPTDARETIRLLSGSGVDLLEISSGAYLPGAPSASESGGSKLWLLELCAEARRIVDAPVTAAAGFRLRAAAAEALRDGSVDLVGMGRPFCVYPDLPRRWAQGPFDAATPRFASPPPNGVTAWHTMQLTAFGETGALDPDLTPESALEALGARDRAREPLWRARTDAFRAAADAGA